MVTIQKPKSAKRIYSALRGKDNGNIERFEATKRSAVKIVTKQFYYSTIPTILIRFPIRNLFFFTVICFALSMTSAAHAGGVIQLPQTGQTKCYDTSGNTITCTGTGQDGELQTGVAWPNPRFTSGTGAESECMIDNLTGLMWPKNGNLSSKTWNDAIDYTKTLTLCGHSDWRLPNINELESLVNVSQSNPNTWLNTQGFTGVRTGIYWSSTTDAFNTGYAWDVDMWIGNLGYDVKTNAFYVWPVRSGQSGSSAPSVIWQTGQAISYRTGDDGDFKQGVTWPSPRFSDQVTGEVVDNLTGLVWTKDANAPGPTPCSPGATKTWQGALDYVKCLNTQKYLGHTDWRLPNRKELRSIPDQSRYNTALPSGHPFTSVQSSNYWSSTTNAFYTVSGNAWYINMGDGATLGYYKTSYNYVWPVRSGQFVNLVVSKSGTGTGTVTSSPSGVNCGSDCSENYASGTSVTLNSQPSADSSFTGWSGDCSGNQTTCTLTMHASKNVTAFFAIPGGPGDLSIPLLTGWSFISLPKHPPDTGIGTVLGNASPNVRIVWGYDNQNKIWKRYKPGGTANTLSNMEAGNGYWIYANREDTISMKGYADPPSTVHLYEGWNLVGYSGTENKEIAASLGTISDTWLLTWNWDNGIWKAKAAPDFNPVLSVPELTTLNMGKAYWIRTKIGKTGDWDQQSKVTPPSPPTGLMAAEVNGNQINLSWAAASGNAGIAGYYVYQGTTRIADVKTTSYSITNFDANAQSSYTIRAYDAYGNISGDSTQLTVGGGSSTLTVVPSGAGSGKVTSAKAGINCGSTCSVTLIKGTSVTLTATPSADAFFANWAGACTGTGACVVKMDEAKSVVATFSLSPLLLTIPAGAAMPLTPLQIIA
ncbi:MAG: DUF1566 domain-containing protein, partial [Deltaproteobacteria bacterium]